MWVGRVPNILGTLGPAPWDLDVADPLEICASHTSGRMSISVILGQTIRA